MNDKAFRLGLQGTHFENPNGLDSPNHYSTARDLAVLAAYAMKNPIFYQTVSTKSVGFGGRRLQNHNKLLWRVDGADGVKTGYTKAAGRILVSSATRQGRRLICVTINDGNDWQDHSALLEDGFSRYTIRQIVEEGEILGTVEVLGGSGSPVTLRSAEDFSYPMAEGERISVTLSGPGFVYAPVVADAQAGYAHICLDGSPVGKVKLVYEETVEQIQTEEPSFWKRLFGGGS
jgi:D-alanyl-D-alanine carboxypeptidase